MISNTVFWRPVHRVVDAMFKLQESENQIELAWIY